MNDSADIVTDFSEPDFRNILQALGECGYRFCRFDQPHDGEGRRVYLRHDVDISPAMALRLGTIEKECRVVANYFFQMNADTYSGLAPETIAIIRELRSMGHGVGLHIDENLIAAEASAIRKTIDWFDDCVTPIDKAISFHRPSQGVLGRDFDGFANAYGSPFFHPDGFFSDSRRNNKFKGQIINAAQSGVNPLQLLLHPCWWYPEADMKAFADRVLARRRAETVRYLRKNFAAVFTPVIAADEEQGPTSP